MDQNNVNMQENRPEQTSYNQNAQQNQQFNPNTQYNQGNQQNLNNQAPSQNSKAGIGVVCGIFLGLIGLLVGFLCYKDKNLEYEWKTFLKGWLWSFFITLGVTIVATIIYFVAFASLFAGTVGVFQNTIEEFAAIVVAF